MTTDTPSTFLPSEDLEQQIFIIRGQKVMLDFHLAKMYEVETKVFNQAVKRNSERFPEDFRFQLSEEETEELNRSQIVTSSQKHRDPKYRPYAFTEQGVAMLSGVLRSPRAVEVNIAIMRAFVKIRAHMLNTADLATQLAHMEQKYDKNFKVVFDALQTLTKKKDEPPPKPRKLPVIVVHK